MFDRHVRRVLRLITKASICCVERKHLCVGLVMFVTGEVEVE